MTLSLPTPPDWNAAHLGAVVPALQCPVGQRPEWLPSVVQNAEQVVLVVLDGLGTHALDPEQTPTVFGMEGSAMTTICPATTAAALTSLTTGCLPGRHGITGFRMRCENEVLNVLRWKTPSGNVPNPERIQRLPAFGGLPVPVIAPAQYQRSQFTKAHLRGVPYLPALSRATSIELVAQAVTEGHSLIYLYDPLVDEVAHRYGLHDGMFESEVRSADAFITQLLERLPSEVAVLVTADHGQVHIEGWIELPPSVEAEVAMAAGDARFRSLYAYPGRSESLQRVARDEMESVAWVASRDELIASGWLGPVGATAAKRIGDVVLVPRGPMGIVDRMLPGEQGLRSAHGGFSPDEMMVPLRASSGRST